MKKIKIQKFCDNNLVDTFEIPVLLVSMASKFLPNTALLELEKKGIYIEKMVELSKTEQDFSSDIEVSENGIKTQVKISLIY